MIDGIEVPKRPCKRCGRTIDNLGDSHILKIDGFSASEKEKSYIICEKCKCSLLEWLLEGDPIQSRINKEERASH